jgi:hypothetical protein
MNEIGFVAVDANPSAEYLGLYEVFVPRDPEGRTVVLLCLQT